MSSQIERAYWVSKTVGKNRPPSKAQNCEIFSTLATNRVSFKPPKIKKWLNKTGYTKNQESTGS